MARRLRDSASVYRFSMSKQAGRRGGEWAGPAVKMTYLTAVVTMRLARITYSKPNSRSTHG